MKEFSLMLLKSELKQLIRNCCEMSETSHLTLRSVVHESVGDYG